MARGTRDTKIQVIEVSVSSLYYLFSVARLTKIEKLKDIKHENEFKLEKTGKKHTKRRVVSVKMYMLFS